MMAGGKERFQDELSDFVNAFEISSAEKIAGLFAMAIALTPHSSVCGSVHCRLDLDLESSPTPLRLAQ